jgi:sugar lactone lactonase YvrE
VADISNVSVTCLPTYTISGNVSGLISGQVTLLNNAADPQIVASNSGFHFRVPVVLDSSYVVTVGTQPVNHFCTVNNGSALKITANVANVAVSCIAYTINPSNVKSVFSTLAGTTPEYMGITVDSLDNLYAIAFQNSVVTIQSITPAGQVSVLAPTVPTCNCWALAVDRSNTLYMSDQAAFAPTDIFKIPTSGVNAGVVSGFAATPGGPAGLAFDANGNLWSGNSNSANVTEFNSVGVLQNASTISGVTFPLGLAFASNGDLYFVSGTTVIYKIAAGAAGATVFADLSTSTDPIVATSYLNQLAFDHAGNLYSTDYGAVNSTGGNVIKITPAGVATLVASGFNGANGIAFDSNGNLFVSDNGNGYNGNVVNIWKITPN